ncbi:MAG: hypothetical protein HY055_15245, partial [Magnetospirillum sp.]|nr:hypothetical protein [Magnetospirillum sp.]
MSRQPPPKLDGSGLEGSGLDRDGLRRAQAAGERLDVLGRALGAGPVDLLTGSCREVEALRHYPAGDVYDMGSHAQFYYHSHRDVEFGHIHLFQRPRGMPAGIAPAEPGRDGDAPCHLIAVGFGPRGEVTELFTTNRWVTGEAWYTARSVKGLVAALRLNIAGPYGPVAAWLAALVEFYRPLIERLVDERDQAIADWRAGHGGRDALADERLEITSIRAVNP